MRQSELATALAARDRERCLGLERFGAPLPAPRTQVWVKYYLAQARWLRATGVVAGYDADGSCRVRFTGGHGPARGSVLIYPPEIARNVIVPAGIAADPPSWYQRGQRLRGKILQLYWPQMDRFYPGKVLGVSPDESYLIRYDDGEVLWEELWDAAAWNGCGMPIVGWHVVSPMDVPSEGEPVPRPVLFLD